MAAGRVLRVRRAGILQVGLELNGRDGLREVLARDLAHGFTAFRRDQSGYHDVTVFPQLADLFQLRLIRHSGSQEMHFAGRPLL
jgi:hypothetical protein